MGCCVRFGSVPMGPIPAVARAVGDDEVQGPREKPKLTVSLPTASGKREGLDGVNASEPSTTLR